MSSLAKSALAAVALAFIAGTALAAEACCCCKEGAKMECCDKMKDKAATPPKSDEAKPAQPEHKH